MSGDLDIENRIYQCEAMLGEGIKFKVHDGDFRQSIEIFRRAYEIATCEPRLPKPWPQIAAYRLAHVCMRDAKGFADLEMIEELFHEAARLGVDVLGPLPSIYRIAALQRMTLEAPDDGIAEACRTARARLFAELAGGAEAYSKSFSSPEHQAVVQGTLYNYLELASYFTGERYDLIHAMASPIGDMMLDPEWLIFGTRGVGRNRFVRMGTAMARAELESRAESGSADLLFEIGDITVGESGRVWIRGQKPVDVRLRPLLLLLKYCRSPEASSVELERSVIRAGQEGGTRLKDVADDLRKGLGPYAEINGIRVVKAGSRTEPPRLNPEIRVVGMVHPAWATAAPPPLGRYEHQSRP